MSIEIVDNYEEIINKRRLIEATKGRIFSLCFIKKDGTERIMQAIYQSNPNASGGNPDYKLNYQHILVQEISGNRSYEDRPRTINLEALKWLKEGGNVHEFC